LSVGAASSLVSCAGLKQVGFAARNTAYLLHLLPGGSDMPVACMSQLLTLMLFYRRTLRISRFRLKSFQASIAQVCAIQKGRCY
jgi:hypothetical protein